VYVLLSLLDGVHPDADPGTFDDARCAFGLFVGVIEMVSPFQSVPELELATK
jgi:hypothetical protein